jgi:hypothetical protein
MASMQPMTITEYIRAASLEGQPHLRRLYAILRSAAPEPEEAIKWGTAFNLDRSNMGTDEKLRTWHGAQVGPADTWRSSLLC